VNRLAIITTHPIQYYAPLFKLLNERNHADIKVFYTWGKNSVKKFDPAFGKNIDWDIPLLEGYDYEWAENISPDPGSHHFKGIITPGLVGQIKAYTPDAILVFGWAYQSHLKVIRYFKNKVPVYFRGDSTLLDEQKGTRAILKTIFLRWVYSHINHAFFVGTNNKAYYKKYGLKEKQLSFAPHAIDNQRFEVDRTDEVSILRKSLGITTKNDILLLFAGKFEEKKAPELLLEAFLLLKKPNVHLLFVGNGALENILRDKAGENKNIHFMDFQNQSAMPVMYQACDLFCLPSQGPGETWGLAVNEAMACKKAIIVSDKCGCAIDLVKKGNGIIFKSRDITELQSALATLTADLALLIACGKKSKSIINDWSFERIAVAIESQLRTLNNKH
jgi:glycosyltransferase involved in cell wall biosynthesis